jgi:two-component system, cell cycle sensor histidine kinase and response regulator CckA
MPGADGRYRVLIVDDEPAVGLLLNRILAEAGYDTAIALDAADALRRQADGPPFDLLLADVLMPDMTGDELVRVMRQTQPDLKALYVTGFADHLFWEKPVLDDEAFVEKPISPAGLLEAVSLALFGHTRGL